MADALSRPAADTPTVEACRRVTTAGWVGNVLVISFAVVGPAGAVEFRLMTRDGPLGPVSPMGFEMHARAPLDGGNHSNCWLIEGPCCHDGTSLWAIEHWMPLFRNGGTKALWPALEAEYRRRFALAKDPPDAP